MSSSPKKATSATPKKSSSAATQLKTSHMSENRQLPTGEEKAILTIPGHTVHFDGEQDQGRDRQTTKYLVPKGVTLSKALNQMDRQEGLAEVRGLLRGF